MVETNLLRRWDGIVESVAFVAIVILAIGVMVSAIKPSDAAKHLGALLCIVILLIVLPAIIVSAWYSMSLWQHLGISMLGAMVGLSILAARQTRKKR